MIIIITAQNCRYIQFLLSTEKELKKEILGIVVDKTPMVDGVKTTLIIWIDNKPVNMLSTFVGATTTKKKTLS